MCKKGFVSLTVALAVFSWFLPAQSVSANAPLGINLATPVYYSSEFPFKNIGKMMDIRDENGRDRIYILWDLPGHFPTGDYVIFYDGSGTIDSFLGSNITIKEQSAGRMVITVTGGNGISFKRDKTITNMRVILPGYEDSYETDPWNPSFLAKWAGFTVIRFMDWVVTNGNSSVDWADRTLVSDEAWDSNSVPWEMCIRLANRLDADPWINIPAKATDDYVAQLANLVNTELASGHKVYVEYSNECWNFSFSQAAYCHDNGVAEALDSDSYTAGFKWYSKRAVQIFDIFTNTLGADRVVRVMGGWADNSWHAGVLLSYNNAYQKTDVLAIAPYFGDDYTVSIAKGWTVTQLFDHIQTDSGAGLARAKQQMVNNRTVATSYGVGLVCYEAGQSLVDWTYDSNMTTLFTTANRSDRMNDCYDTYLNDWNTVTEGQGMMCLFSSTGRYSQYGSWGLTEWNEQNDTPKYNAVKDWMSAVPQPPSQATSPSPAYDATGVSTTATVSWTAGANATSHDVYFGTSSPGIFIGNRAGTTYIPGTIAANTTYYWRIDEKNTAGTTTGVVWHFTTGSGIMPVQLLAWDFVGEGGATSSTAEVFGTGIATTSPSGVASFGSGLTALNYLSNGLTAVNQTTLTLAAALSGNEYFTWSIAPKSGYKMSLTSVDIRPVSQNRARTFTLFSSVNGFTEGQQVGSFTESVNMNAPIHTVTLAGHTNLTSTVEFRLYVYGYDNSYESVGMGNGDGMDLIVKGTTMSCGSDLNCDDSENFVDFAIFAPAWKSRQGETKWNSACDLASPKDNIIDWKDLAVFAEDWLKGV